VVIYHKTAHFRFLTISILSFIAYVFKDSIRKFLLPNSIDYSFIPLILVFSENINNENIDKIGIKSYI